MFIMFANFQKTCEISRLNVKINLNHSFRSVTMLYIIVTSVDRGVCQKDLTVRPQPHHECTRYKNNEK